jgi:hypothetical protein
MNKLFKILKTLSIFFYTIPVLGLLLILLESFFLIGKFSETNFIYYKYLQFLNYLIYPFLLYVITSLVIAIIQLRKRMEMKRSILYLLISIFGGFWILLITLIMPKFLI